MALIKMAGELKDPQTRSHFEREGGEVIDRRDFVRMVIEVPCADGKAEDLRSALRNMVGERCLLTVVEEQPELPDGDE